MRKYKAGDIAYVSGMYFGLSHEVRVRVLTHDYDMETGWYYDVMLDYQPAKAIECDVLSLPENRLHAKSRVPKVKAILSHVAEEE